MNTFNALYGILPLKINDTNIIYSIHEPEVLCIANGKENKPMSLGTRLLSPIPEN
jgi:hypothetical protein